MEDFRNGIDGQINTQQNAEFFEDALQRFFNYDLRNGDDPYDIKSALDQAGVTTFLELIALSDEDIIGLVAVVFNADTNAHEVLPLTVTARAVVRTCVAYYHDQARRSKEFVDPTQFKMHDFNFY